MSKPRKPRQLRNRDSRITVLEDRLHKALDTHIARLTSLDDHLGRVEIGQETIAESDAWQLYKEIDGFFKQHGASRAGMKAFREDKYECTEAFFEISKCRLALEHYYSQRELGFEHKFLNAFRALKVLRESIDNGLFFQIVVAGDRRGWLSELPPEPPLQEEEEREEEDFDCSLGGSAP